CERDEAAAKFDAIRKKLAQSGNPKPEEIAAAQQAKAEILGALSAAANRCEQTSAEASPASASAETRLRALYQAAWCYRAVGQAQLEDERNLKQAEALLQLRKTLEARIPAGQPKPDLRPVEIPLSQLVVPNGEQQAVKTYHKLIEAGPDSQLALDVRL